MKLSLARVKLYLVSVPTVQYDSEPSFRWYYRRILTVQKAASLVVHYNILCGSLKSVGTVHFRYRTALLYRSGLTTTSHVCPNTARRSREHHLPQPPELYQ